MEEKGKKTVAIVGAGLTGLTTAFYLKKAGIGFQVFADRVSQGKQIASKIVNSL